MDIDKPAPLAAPFKTNWSIEELDSASVIDNVKKIISAVDFNRDHIFQHIEVNEKLIMSNKGPAIAFTCS